MPPPPQYWNKNTHTAVSSFLHECWGLNLVPRAYEESILQTLEFYVIYGPKYRY